VTTLQSHEQSTRTQIYDHLLKVFGVVKIASLIRKKYQFSWTLPDCFNFASFLTSNLLSGIMFSTLISQRNCLTDYNSYLFCFVLFCWERKDVLTLLTCRIFNYRGTYLLQIDTDVTEYVLTVLNCF